MKFTVDRATWRCGNYGPYKKGMGSTKLLNEEGFMCCLGQCALQLGATKEQILDAFGPTQLPMQLSFLSIPSEDSGLTLTNLSIQAMNINDSNNFTPKNREELLIQAFARDGHELEFVGEYNA